MTEKERNRIAVMARILLKVLNEQPVDYIEIELLSDMADEFDPRDLVEENYGQLF
jgi:hypothetical protein